MFKRLLFLVFIFSTLIGRTQDDQQDYEGEWIGYFPNKNCFNFHISLKKLKDDNYHLTIANDEILIDENLESSGKDHLQFNINQQLFLDLEFTQEEKALTGFIKTGRLLYRIHLVNVGNSKFIGIWNPFMFDNELQSDDIILYVDNTEDSTLVAYPFFGEQRFRGIWLKNFEIKRDILSFLDSNTGFNFRANLRESKIELEIYLTNALITKTNLVRVDDAWEYKTNPVELTQNTYTPEQLNDGWTTASINDYGIGKSHLLRLIESIHSGKLINVHSVLIAKDNKLVYENYYGGFNANIPHDLRSASKSISSAMVGIAINDGIVENVDKKLYDLLPKEYQYTIDSSKAKIRLKDLLTMSSGLDVNELASEGYYQNQANPNSWLKSVLEAPIVKEPGTFADYGSANPFLLGICLNECIDIPLKNYIHEKLFKPLGITNYVIQTDDTELIPYFGGGMFLTPRDMLKFGQLYLNDGKWNGEEIIAEEWIEESFKKHVRLQDVMEKNEYGYQWWHEKYSVNGKEISSIEARGAGGQYIFIIPQLESVIVITSGNFRNGKGNQPRKILREYILPALTL